MSQLPGGKRVTTVRIAAVEPALELARRYLYAALERSGARPDEIVHVGDNPEHDVRPAQALGMYTVWMNMAGAAWSSGEPADEEVQRLEELPDAIARINARALASRR